MKEYERPSITIATFETEDIITTSSFSPQFTESGDVTGQEAEWKITWNAG